MKITHLRLSNYRCFESFEMNFHEQLTVIVGVNGVGKTALLDALTVALSPYLRHIDEGKITKFAPSDALRKKNPKNEFVMEPQYPIQLEAMAKWSEDGLIKKTHNPQNVEQISETEFFQRAHNGDLTEANKLIYQQKWGKNSYFLRCYKNNPKAGHVITYAHELTNYGRRMQFAARKMESVILPILGYYGTGRLWKQEELDKPFQHLLSESRTVGYRDCLNPASSFKEFAYWFKQLSIAITNTIDLESQGIDTHHGERLRELRSAVVDAINACLEQSDWCNLYYDAAEDQIQVKHNDGGVMPVAQLSDGVRSVLALAADIAFRCCKLNGHLGTEAVTQTPGIVMIDELDLHLHPSWQQTIVPAFQKSFPKIQFIITTHSPHLLSTVPSGCIRILAKGKITLPHIETEGEQSQAVLEDIFGVSAWPPMQIAAKLKDYLRLVDHQEYDTLEGKALRAELEDHYGKGHVELSTADIVIMRHEAIKQARQSRA